jgi:hypothetical protein
MQTGTRHHRSARSSRSRPGSCPFPGGILHRWFPAKTRRDHRYRFFKKDRSMRRAVPLRPWDTPAVPIERGQLEEVTGRMLPISRHHVAPRGGVAAARRGPRHQRRGSHPRRCSTTTSSADPPLCSGSCCCRARPCRRARSRSARRRPRRTGCSWRRSTSGRGRPRLHRRHAVERRRRRHPRPARRPTSRPTARPRAARSTPA